METRTLGAAEITRGASTGAPKRDERPLIPGQSHSLWWHLLIFHRCIDQLSIVLILFLHGDNSINSLCPQPRTELTEPEGQRGCSVPSFQLRTSVCCSRTGGQDPTKLWFCRSRRAGHRPQPPPHPAPPAVKRMRGSWEPPAGDADLPGRQTTHRDGQGQVPTTGTQGRHGSQPHTRERTGPPPPRSRTPPRCLSRDGSQSLQTRLQQPGGSQETFGIKLVSS